MKVTMEPWTPAWDAAFAVERERIATTLAHHVVGIEHIGSTAVTGLVAKPILDLQVAVARLEAFDMADAAAPMAAFGYEHRKDLVWMVPFRRFLQRRSSPHGPDCQIHLVEAGHPWWDRHLVFRNYLRVNEKARTRYAELKLALAEREWVQILDYTNSKTELIFALEEEAFEHFALSETERARLRGGRVD